jgi:hypothetical protein
VQSFRCVVTLFATMVTASCAQVDQGVGPRGDAGSGGGRSSGTASGGTGAITPGSGGDMRGTTGNGGAGGETSCGMESFALTRQAPDVMLVLDRSASMKKNSEDKTSTGPSDPRKWDQVVPALTSVIPSAGANISWGLKVFPEDGSECAAQTVTTNVDVPIMKMNAAAVVSAINATMPEGNGTPTGAAIEVAANYLTKMVTDDKPKYLLLATDGQPSCAGSAGSLSKTTDGARTAAVAAVTAAAAAGIHTFVVGVATSKDNDAETLNMLATAGLEPRVDANPSATKFYLTTNQAELVAAMQAISSKVDASCVFPLSKAPPVPENIAVKVMGVKSPYDASNGNGWNYTSADHHAVEVFGSWCEMVKKDANKVEIIFGCPNVPIP